MLFYYKSQIFRDVLSTVKNEAKFRVVFYFIILFIILVYTICYNPCSFWILNFYHLNLEKYRKSTKYVLNLLVININIVHTYLFWVSCVLFVDYLVLFVIFLVLYKVRLVLFTLFILLSKTLNYA